MIDIGTVKYSIFKLFCHMWCIRSSHIERIGHIHIERILSFRERIASYIERIVSFIERIAGKIYKGELR